MADATILSRRTTLAGIAGLALAAPAAGDGSSPVARGVLKNNKLAQAFAEAPASLPNVTITGPGGERNIAELLNGRVVLMPIWAEWCLPCLLELPDFARLQQVYGNGKFAIVPVLSGAKHQMSMQATAELLSKVGAAIFEPLVEHGYGNRLIARMGSSGNEYHMPCNLLIGADGRVLGREIGIKSNRPADAPDDKTVAAAFDRLDRAATGQTQSLWGTPAGDEFAVAISAGYFP